MEALSRAWWSECLDAVAAGDGFGVYKSSLCHTRVLPFLTPVLIWRLLSPWMAGGWRKKGPGHLPQEGVGPRKGPHPEAGPSCGLPALSHSSFLSAEPMLPTGHTASLPAVT